MKPSEGLVSAPGLKPGIFHTLGKLLTTTPWSHWGDLKKPLEIHIAHCLPHVFTLNFTHDKYGSTLWIPIDLKSVVVCSETSYDISAFHLYFEKINFQIKVLVGQKETETCSKFNSESEV